MTEDWRQDAARVEQAATIDSTKPNALRIADYFDGGKDNFEADRRTARALLAAAPAIAMIAPSWRAFVRRAVRYLMDEAGVRQFLFVGATLSESNAHETIWSADPGSRIVIADDDPLALAHARALMRPEPNGAVGRPSGAIGYVNASMLDPRAIVKGARETLDFGQPVAVMLMFVLAFVADTTAAADVVSALADAVPSGSHVVIHHVASDLDPALTLAARRWNQQSRKKLTLRSRAEVASLVSGLEIVSPGVVPIDDWRPESDDSDSGTVIPLHGVIGRKQLMLRRRDGSGRGWRRTGGRTRSASSRPRRSTPPGRTLPASRIT